MIDPETIAIKWTSIKPAIGLPYIVATVGNNRVGSVHEPQDKWGKYVLIVPFSPGFLEDQENEEQGKLTVEKAIRQWLRDMEI